MAKKRSKAAVFCVVLAGVVLGGLGVANWLGGAGRLEPVLVNIDGDPKTSGRTAYAWLGAKQILLGHNYNEEQYRYNLETKQQAPVTRLPSAILGISPDGTYVASCRQATGKAGTLGSHITATRTDGTGKRVWENDHWPGEFRVMWTHDGAYAFYEASIGPATLGKPAPEQRLFRLCFKDSEPSARSYPIAPGNYYWLGIDSKNRLLALDAEATRQTAGQGMASGSVTPEFPGDVIFSELAVVAFPLNEAGEPVAADKPQRFTLRKPSNAYMACNLALSPDGTKMAWMTQEFLPRSELQVLLPDWLSSRMQEGKIQFWITDLSDEVIQKKELPKAIFTLPFDRRRATQNTMNVLWRQQPNGFYWVPDSKSLSFLDDDTIWRLPVP